MKKFIYLFLAMAVVTTTFTSCLDDDADDNSYTVTRTYNDCFLFLTDITDGTQRVIKDTQLSVAFTYLYGNKVTCTASVAIKNVPNIAGGLADVQFSKLPVSITDHESHLVTATNLSPDNNRAMTFNSFTLEWLDRSMSNVYIPVVQLKFTVDNRYQVTLVPKNYYLFGKTTVTAPGSTTASYTNEKMWYQLTVNPEDMKCSMFLHDCQLAEKMPAMDMNFAGIDFNPTNAAYTVSASQLIPTINNVPFPNYEVTNVNGVGQYDSKMTFRFTVKDLGSVSAQLFPYYQSTEK